MGQQVLVAIDDSEPATAALEYALTRFNNAEITVLYVADIVDATDIRQRILPTECAQQREAAERAAETVLRNARASADAAGIDLTTVTVVGRPARQILAYAEENAIDTIVMGTHGRSGLDRLLRGSLSDLVTHQASIPVMTVPAPVPDSRHPIDEHQGQIHEDLKRADGDKPPPAPVFRWCSGCAVTLYTQVEFCPGCLDELVPAARAH